MTKPFLLTVAARNNLLNTGRFTAKRGGNPQPNKFLKQLDDTFRLLARQPKPHLVLQRPLVYFSPAIDAKPCAIGVTANSGNLCLNLLESKILSTAYRGSNSVASQIR